MQSLAVLNEARAAADLPAVTVDIALHVGEVLYGMLARPTGSTSRSSDPPSTRSRASKRCASRWAGRS